MRSTSSFRRPVRMFLVLACAALLPAGRVSAQALSPAAATDQLTVSQAMLASELSRGDTVSLVKVTGELVTGRVLRVDASEIEIRSERPLQKGRRAWVDLSVPLDHVASLDRQRDPTSNGLLIGAGIGAGVGIGLLSYAYAVDANESDEWLGGYMITTAAFAGIGALVGWAVDAVHSKPHFRYRREEGASRIRVAPTFTQGPGLAVSVTF